MNNFFESTVGPADTTDHFNRFEVIDITDEERQALAEYQEVIGKLNAEIEVSGHDAARAEFGRRREKFLNTPTSDEAINFLRHTAESKEQIIASYVERSATLKEARRRVGLQFSPAIAGIFARVKRELDAYVSDVESDLRERCDGYKVPYQPDVVTQGLKARSQWCANIIKTIEGGGSVEPNIFKGVIDLEPSED